MLKISAGIAFFNGSTSIFYVELFNDVEPINSSHCHFESPLSTIEMERV